jgi:radical SAM protein with 4Fe4S-binding SPASM domain
VEVTQRLLFVRGAPRDTEVPALRVTIYNRPIHISPRLLYRIPLNLLSLALDIRPLALPVCIQVEPSNSCNLKCNMCPISHQTRRRGTLDLDIFKRVIKEVKPPYLIMTGYTEAVLHRDCYEMIDFASRFATVKMDTNATLLDERRISRLLETKLDIISVSLDSTDPDNYKAIRLGAEMGPVLENMMMLDSMRKERGSSLQLHINAVIQRLNIDDLAGVARFSAEVGADFLGVGFVSTYGIEEYKRLCITAEDLPRLQKSMDGARAVAEEHGLKIDLTSLELLIKHKADYHKITRVTPCYSPWYYAYVSCDGGLFPCCMMYDGQVCFGNLHDKPFKKIWFSKEYTDFRKKLRTRKTGFCAGCICGAPDVLEKLERIPLVKMPHKYSDYWPS